MEINKAIEILEEHLNYMGDDVKDLRDATVTILKEYREQHQKIEQLYKQRNELAHLLIEKI